MYSELKPRYLDKSTTEVYLFSVYCNCCGKLVKTYSSRVSACHRPRLIVSASERKAKEMLWLQGHRAALKHTIDDAQEELNQCELCGGLICDECSVISDRLNGGIACKSCAEKINKKLSGGKET